MDAFRLTAATGMGAVLIVLDLLTRGSLTLDDLRAHMDLGMLAACLGVAVADWAGILYDVPRAYGGRVWSLTLAWTHYGLATAGMLAPLLVLRFGPELDDVAAAQLLVGIVLLQLAGFVTMVVNLLQTVTTVFAAPPELG